MVKTNTLLIAVHADSKLSAYLAGSKVSGLTENWGTSTLS